MSFTWIGVSDTEEEGSWRAVDRNQSTQWTLVTYKNWNSGEPNGNRGENCGMMYPNSGFWNDAPCHNSYHYACKKLQEQGIGC